MGLWLFHDLISKPELYEDDLEGDGRRFYTDGCNVGKYLKELVAAGGIDGMMTVGEMSSTTLENCIGYTSEKNHELTMCFNFHHLKVDYKNGQKWELMPPDHGALKRLFQTWQEGMQEHGGWNALFWCNHDQPRAVSRFGSDTTYWRESAEMLATAIHCMRGTPYIYQGEELGLFEVADIPWDRLEDPTAFHTAQATMDKGRDGCRVPLPWTASDEPALADFSRPAPADDGTGENHVPLCAAGQFGTGASFGFSPAVRADGVTPAADPHLPQPLWFKDYAVDVEQADPDSMYTLYHAALAIRQESLTATRDTTAEQVGMGDDVVAYTRAAVGGRVFTSITNFGNAPIALPDGSVVLASGPLTPEGQLPTDTSAWVIK